MENIQKPFEELEKRIEERKSNKEKSEKIELLNWVEDEKLPHLTEEIESILKSVIGEITELKEDDYQKLLNIEKEKILFQRLLDEVLDPINKE